MALPLDIPANASKISHPPHPYYPLEVEIVGYLANEWSVPLLLFTFAAGCTFIFSLTRVIVKRIQPTIAKNELLTVMWFVLSESCLFQKLSIAVMLMFLVTGGSIHLFFEGALLPSYHIHPVFSMTLTTPQATTPSTKPAWASYRRSSANCGRNTLFPTRAT